MIISDAIDNSPMNQHDSGMKMTHTVYESILLEENMFIYIYILNDKLRCLFSSRLVSFCRF